MSHASSLLQPLKAGNIQLKNRVIMSPLTRSRHGKNPVMGHQAQVDYYTQRASVGLIVAEASAISEEGLGWGESGTIYRPEDAVGWKKVTDSVHAAGGKIIIQLWHMGRVS